VRRGRGSETGDCHRPLTDQCYSTRTNSSPVTAARGGRVCVGGLAKRRGGGGACVRQVRVTPCGSGPSHDVADHSIRTIRLRCWWSGGALSLWLGHAPRVVIDLTKVCVCLNCQIQKQGLLTTPAPPLHFAQATRSQAKVVAVGLNLNQNTQDTAPQKDQESTTSSRPSNAAPLTKTFLPSLFSLPLIVRLKCPGAREHFAVRHGRWRPIGLSHLRSHGSLELQYCTE